MTRPIRLGLLTAIIICMSISVFAQKPPKAPDYKISTIQVDEAKGDLSDPLDKKNPRVFFNDLSTSLFVWVVIQGQKGSFESGRMISITVTEGKKIKMTRNTQIGLIGEEGFYFVPVYVYGPLCSNVSIAAHITGQRTASANKVSVPFQCGE
jgi:hypothetical protein